MVDELRLYRGESYRVNGSLAIRVPTLGEICDYGESDYFSMVKLFTSTPSDMLWQLDDIGIDYTKVSDWELFYNFLYPQFTPANSGILFGGFDFSALKKYVDKESNEKSLAMGCGGGSPAIIDYYTYLVATEIVRKIHGFKKNEKRPANETTKRILIEDAKEEWLAAQGKEHHSSLKNLISAMVNSEGFKFNCMDVWGMNINAFLDSVKRVSKIKDAGLLMQSGYSGFGIDLKKISNEKLDWLGEL